MMDVQTALAIVLDLAKGRLKDPAYLADLTVSRPADEKREIEACEVMSTLADALDEAPDLCNNLTVAIHVHGG